MKNPQLLLCGFPFPISAITPAFLSELPERPRDVKDLALATRPVSTTAVASLPCGPGANEEAALGAPAAAASLEPRCLARSGLTPLRLDVCASSVAV